MKLTTALLATTAMAFTATAALADGHAKKWDMPLAYSASNFHSENAAEFAKCVGEKSGGALEIVTHPGGSLFKGGEIKRAIQTGQAPIGERLLSAHANENPVFGIDSVPFLATSFDDSVKLHGIAKAELEKALDEQNLELLYSVPWPPQGLYFKKEVNSVADMKGLKFRAYNAATSRLAELTGMQPTQIEAAEVQQAFSTNAVESMVSSGATGYDRKVFEAGVTNYYEVDAWLPRNSVLVNKDAMASLKDDQKAALTECAATAEASGLQKSKDYTQFTYDGLRKGGMTVEPASDGLKTELQAIGATMTEEFLASAGDAGKAIVDEFNK
ncbi:TRAP transporter substrate-binding protein [Ahrensia sp. R2A130]|uniref:TRAP transporter substrate-binding protein n=1 Tax=Ahrensia sp. R2A130 TaxID=744979 RepID=UPI0001E0D12E|nr:TRAP transporter substrate-binding protein [Ahrensia sp. R2A130]EFL87904.1 peptide ABC transporter, solute-binding protein [Ahrensia sp. R2A130]